MSSEAGGHHQRVFLVVVDSSPEMKVALRFACRRARATGGRLAMLSPDRRDVIDPVGGSIDTYRSCARQIHGHLTARMDTLGIEPPDA